MNGMMINTAQFRFPPGSPRPSWTDIANFLKQLDTNLLDMESAYKTARDRSLFIKFTSMDAMKTALKKNSEPRVFLYASGESVEIRMTIAGADMRYVRIFDLPPEIDDEHLSLILEEYGKVEFVIREKFPPESGLGHLQTGVRGVYLDVKKSIPPSIVIAGWKGNVFYDGLKDTCFLCQAVGHRRDSCPKKKVLNPTPKRTEKPTSYAGVVAGNEVHQPEQETTEALEDDIIEVLEESFEQYTDIDSNQVQTQLTGGQEKVDSEKERRRKEGIAVLEDVAKAIQEAMANPQAKQRRAQYAASGSGSSSGSSTAPKKKCARQTRY